MRTRLILCALPIAFGVFFAARSPHAAAVPQQAAAPQPDELAAAPRVTQAEFKTALAAGAILVIDVRDAASYANGHIAGAVSIPLDELPAHAKDLKAARKPIVTYCA
jgi:3-mercaptopyruvate sulfurtransferase SseA